MTDSPLSTLTPNAAQRACTGTSNSLHVGRTQFAMRTTTATCGLVARALAERSRREATT